MKKLAVFVIVLSVMCLVSCQKEEHKHSWKETWEYDLTGGIDFQFHWHTCEDPNCSEVYERGLHCWLDDEMSTDELKDDEKKVYCSVCKATMLVKVVN